jgi:hypothetical protein
MRDSTKQKIYDHNKHIYLEKKGEAVQRKAGKRDNLNKKYENLDEVESFNRVKKD